MWYHFHLTLAVGQSMGIPCLQSIVVCFLLFIDVLQTKGGIVCHYCNSKERQCTVDSLKDTRKSNCARGYDYCSVYRIVFPNQTTAQVTRGCDRECTSPFSKWTGGEKSYCKTCCRGDFCNDQITDPCDKTASFTSKGLVVFAFVSLGLYANCHIPDGWYDMIWYDMKTTIWGH